jgi:phenylalanine-4-hydroxylase
MDMRRFTESEHATWRRLYARLERCRSDLAHPLFVDGLHALGLSGEAIPELAEVNVRLLALTGWRGVPVTGLEDGRHFFALLADRCFPVGAFIRDAKDLSYTPAPDVFHDMYGHLPLFADPAYADFNHRFGILATRHFHDPRRLRQFERLYWFGLEFPLIETAIGRRIFGGGILSSSGESDFALSEVPDVRPFDLEMIRDQEFRIDEMQRLIFVIDRPETLYACLDRFEQMLA